jgi:hypothetical protein
MESIQFNAVVDQEQVIRPPVGVKLPEGEIEVTVRPRQPAHPGEMDALAPTRDWLLALATEAEQAAPALPADLAVHHDHYAHGKPLP